MTSAEDPRCNDRASDISPSLGAPRERGDQSDPVGDQIDLAPDGLPAYARVLLAVLEGDPVLAIRDDEAEESWRIVEPILATWSSGAVPLREYAAGSSGPVESRVVRGSGSEPS